MKKIKIVFFSLFLVSNLYSCGCVDTPQADAGAEQINSSYDEADGKLADEFDNQIEMVNETIDKEIESLKFINNTIKLEVDKIVELDNIGFELIKSKNILKIEN
jgi:hypothetical protein